MMLVDATIDQILYELERRNVYAIIATDCGIYLGDKVRPEDAEHIANELAAVGKQWPIDWSRK